MRPEDHSSGEPVTVVGFSDSDLYQHREKIFTRFVGGFYQRLRYFTGWPLLAGYFLLPWLQWNGRQAVLFDLPARQFHILGLTFWPQDLWLLGWLLIISAFGLFTITTLVGRLWCGYTCPQTVWTAIFMWAEQLAEGSRSQRIRLESAPWSFSKLRKRTFKHSMWVGWAFFTGLTFVGYFTPIRELVVDLASLSAHPWAVFWIGFFTVATYVNAGWLREQVCIYMCPYARFQSAMLDKDTLVVTYDASRGEPRGSRKRGADSDLGDCIDCQLCVQVCPTGIDIRNGLQYECIGCAHCIDACNQVMDKMGYARGLVRYGTERELAGGRTHWLRPRTIGYGLALTVMISAFVTAVITRTPFSLDVLRERGSLYRVTADEQIGNQYQLRVLNKGQTGREFELSVNGPVPLTLAGPQAFRAGPEELLDVPVEVLVAPGELAAPNFALSFELCAAGERCVSTEARFVGPMP